MDDEIMTIYSAQPERASVARLVIDLTMCPVVSVELNEGGSLVVSAIPKEGEPREEEAIILVGRCEVALRSLGVKYESLIRQRGGGLDVVDGIRIRLPLLPRYFRR